jgi:hypothetical protein
MIFGMSQRLRRAFGTASGVPDTKTERIAEDGKKMMKSMIE